MAKTGAKPCSCSICGKQLKNKSQLPYHERIHSGVKPFKCEICGKRSIRRSHHNQHLLTHTVKDKPWACNINHCPAKYKSRDNLSIHKRTVHDLENKARHECIFCQRKFLIKRDLGKHILKHIQERPYLCKFCPQDFQRIEGFRRHLKLQHQPNLQKIYSCQTCSQEFKRKDSLADHIRCRHTKTEATYKCKICAKAFRFSEGLKTHERTHTKPFSCEQCDKAFASKDSLQNHILQHALPGKQYECDICFSRFKLEMGLKVHKKLAHDPAFSKRFECLFCNKGFPRQSSLIEHIQGHTGERPHFCKICGQEFRMKAEMRGHLIRQHKSDRRKEFHCELCPKQYFTNGDLLSHLQRHTGEQPVGCDLCPKRFGNLENLKNHRKRHMKRILLDCELCDKQVMSKDSLQRHMRIHTGEVPIKCRHCEESFGDPTSRHYHEHRQHFGLSSYKVTRGK